jgi:hypothetical protein
VGRHRVQQTLLVTEEAVEGRRLHTGGGAHGPRRDGVLTALSEQLEGCRDDALPDRPGFGVTHVSNDNGILIPLVVPVIRSRSYHRYFLPLFGKKKS